MNTEGQSGESGGGDDGFDGDFDLSGFTGDGASAPKPAGKKPAPKAPRSEGAGPRAGGYERPKAPGKGPRAYGDRPPREGGFDRPKRTYGDRPPREGGFDRSKGPARGPRAYGDRPPREGGFDRPKRAYGDRPPREGGYDRPKRDFGDRPPREGGYDKPKRSFGDRAPRGEGGDFKDRAPRRPAGSFRNDKADRPKVPSKGPRDFGDRPPRPFAPRGERPDGPPIRRFAPRPGAGAPAADAPVFKPVSLEVKPWLSLKQDKGRWKESRFLLEGAKNIADALAASSGIVHEVFVAEDFKDKELLAALKKNRVTVIPVTADDIRALSETETPQGIIAVCNFATLKIDWNKARYVTVLDAVQDPGNVGAILRTSAALGMDALVLGKGSCDPYNPKVVRSSVGALLGMPFETGEDLGSKITFLRQKGFSVVATSSHAKQTLEQAKLRKKVALIVGNEGAGTGASYLDMADAVVKIPLKSKVESLNVAVAHGILSYQLIHGRE